MLRPGDAQVVIRRGEFYAPADLPFEKVQALLPQTWAAKWVEISRAKGYELVTPIRLEREPWPFVCQTELSRSETLNYRYVMTAGFRGEVQLHVVQGVSDDIAAALRDAHPARFQISKEARMV